MQIMEELSKLMSYCLENSNYLKASESATDRTAAQTYQDIANKIQEISKSPLTEDEINMEKLVDSIKKEKSTLKCIVMLKKFKSDNLKK